MPGSRLGSVPRNDGRSCPLQLNFHRWAAADGLINHAITFSQLQQLIELVLRRVGIEIEAQPDLGETDRRVLGDAECAAKIKIAFRRHGARAKREPESITTVGE